MSRLSKLLCNDQISLWACGYTTISPCFCGGMSRSSRLLCSDPMLIMPVVGHAYVNVYFMFIIYNTVCHILLVHCHAQSTNCLGVFSPLYANQGVSITISHTNQVYLSN